MSPSHELVYFDATGRAEIIRICLSIAKADWKDTRFQFDQWPTIKPTTPLGCVPILKIDGVDHVQSMSLARYAGRLAGLYPDNDPLEALVVDEVMDSVNELISKLPRVAPTPEEFETLRKEYQANLMTKYATFVEGIIQRNGGVGIVSTFSVGDMALHTAFKNLTSGRFEPIDPNFLDNYPGILATCKMVDDHELVKAYYSAKEN